MLVSQLEVELDLLANVKNVAHLENISTMRLASVDHAVMDSSNQMKVHLLVKFAVLVKQLDQLKLNRVLSAVMNVFQACNLELTENASHVHVALIELKEFNQLVSHVHSEERHLKLAHQLLKNVHCQFVHPEIISMRQLMSVLNAVKDIINPSHNKPLAYHAHQIIALKILPQPQRLNVQIHAKVPPRVINTAMLMLIVFSYQRLQTLNASVSQALMELEFIVQV